MSVDSESAVARIVGKTVKKVIKSVFDADPGQDHYDAGFLIVFTDGSTFEVREVSQSGQIATSYEPGVKP